MQSLRYVRTSLTNDSMCKSVTLDTFSWLKAELI